jgi:hypothetical protein
MKLHPASQKSSESGTAVRLGAAGSSSLGIAHGETKESAAMRVVSEFLARNSCPDWGSLKLYSIQAQSRLLPVQRTECKLD